VKCSETLPTSFWVSRAEQAILLRNNFRNFGTLKWCTQAGNMSYASFYVPKDSEMLWNTPKHHFGSNGAEQAILLRNNFRNFGTLKWCTQDRNTSFASFYVSKDCEMLRNTPNIILGLTSKTGDFTSKQFLQLQYTKMVHSGRKHEFCILLRAQGLRNAPIHSQTSFWV
jgi:hypothetical protein